MKPYLILLVTVALALTSLAIPVRAANQPRAGKTEQPTVVWTNNKLERLRAMAPISVVGQAPEEATAVTVSPYARTQNPEWYAAQASRLRAELKYRQARLQHFRQAIEDARDLKTAADGTNLEYSYIGITPEDGIDILQRSMQEEQIELDALEELARHNDIPPGTLRGE
jgi:hypothetical protein